MPSEKWEQLRILFERVADQDPDQRERTLAEVRIAAPELYREVLALCGADSTPDSLIDRPLSHLLPRELHSGAQLLDRFEVQECLGSGGMGEVWAAVDRQTGTRVAIKTMRRALTADDRVIALFQREIELAARIQHPNVCRVYELFEDRAASPAIRFFTMELLDGESLAARLRRGPLPLAEALAVTRDVCQGLDAAHRAGVIHRDLKPANVILTTRDGVTSAVITDFGLAKPQDSSATQGPDSVVGLLLGTPAYMAPEQAQGLPSTSATDIYALGLMLYEMLSGEPAFSGRSTLDSWIRRAREGPSPLAGRVPGVKRSIDEALRRALAYETSERFQTASEFLNALRLRVLLRRRTRLALVTSLGIVVILTLTSGVRPYRGPATETSLVTAARQDFRDAQMALAEGAVLHAREVLTASLTRYPFFQPNWAAMVEVDFELSRPAEAASLARDSLGGVTAAELQKLDPGERLYVGAIRALAFTDCPAAVESMKARASQHHPPSGDDVVVVSRLMRRCNRPDDAEAYLQSARPSTDPIGAHGLALERARVSLELGKTASMWLATRRMFLEPKAQLDGALEGDLLEARSDLIAKGPSWDPELGLESAQTLLSEAEPLASKLADRRQDIRLRLLKAALSRRRGDLTQAQALTEGAIDLARREDLETVLIEGLLLGGEIHMGRLEWTQAEALFTQAGEIAHVHHNQHAGAVASLGLARAFAGERRRDAARRALRDAISVFEQFHDERRLRAGRAIDPDL